MCAFNGRPNIILLPLQGEYFNALKPRALSWAMDTIGLFFDIIGCGSAIQVNLIAFALHDNSARFRSFLR